ncbi:mannose-ethanolamine phosphotransferase gpi13 [Steccherinum ochraceum]|uniref:Mannose-ethanolamine phosphotransferase gpi13 n=1 Tax=Steccherinum ochraceum TaxID=92696 RepID=A0A4V2MWF1_9APHY|nr:mannose-ethanolamine phosphotransferase gpi13 [Steccherinum ochraceum]
MLSKGFPLLFWVFLVHLAGIYLYTRGFLLTRLALPDISTCTPESCPFPPSYNKAVILIIDSLRFDFISPNPPHPPSLYHHHVLSLPAELTRLEPEHSLLLNSFPDPPTTTLQRIKALTTGSLPTFVDMGSNFGGSSILEDTIIGQLLARGKNLAFMGDDTWMTVFPDSFNQSWPFDSFHVEDLHTVDLGVIKHLFPLLHENAQNRSWDLIVGHFLGVDHVGHRMGPESPVMKTKLLQMDNVLREVVDAMDDDTLLILLGDHGMDSKGDHGGDGVLETSAGLWFYGKGRPLVNPKVTIPDQYKTYRTYPGSTVPHRHVQQIDLLPSLSLLMGLPIPFNNLGSIIPELFWLEDTGETFKKALGANALQIRQYLDTYRASSAGQELDDAWDRLQNMWNVAQGSNGLDDDLKWSGLDLFTRLALSACRAIWAQFNMTLIILGLILLAVGTIAAWSLYSKLGSLRDDWDTWGQAVTRECLQWSGIGSTVGLIAYLPTAHLKVAGILDCVIFGAFFASSVALIHATRSSLVQTVTQSIRFWSVPIPLILHTIAFMSNSFILWEDRLTTFLLLSSIVPFVLTGITAPTSRLRYRILGFSALFAVSLRLIGISTVCREEQQPYCEVTFFASSAITAPPALILAVSIPFAVGLPFIVNRFLRISQSDKGIAAILLPWILPSLLLQASVAWILEWVDVVGFLGPSWTPILRAVRTSLGWLSLGGVILIATSLWYHVTLCIEVKTREQGEKREVTVIGFANLFGSSFLMFWLISFVLVYIATQLTGQVILCLGAITLLSFLEVVDSVRDVRGMNLAFASATPSQILEPEAMQGTLSTLGVTFAEITPLALLGVHLYYGTGHQATIPSLQWKAAFVFTGKMYKPFAIPPLLLNTFGAFILPALAVPLLALWNTAPLPHPTASHAARRLGVKAGLGIMVYYGWLLIGSAVSSAWLRRHLMVWKVFAPRFMLAASSLLAVDLAVLLAVGVGMGRVEKALERLLGAMPSMNSKAKMQ